MYNVDLQRWSFTDGFINRQNDLATDDNMLRFMHLAQYSQTVGAD